MKTHSIENSKTEHRRKQPVICAGMHPGGGFVAWPDGRTSGTPKKRGDNFLMVCRGNHRKGFVAWPEKE